MRRVFELRNEIDQFLSDQNSNLTTHFKDPVWNAKLAYLADVFDELNKLNTSMQGPKTNNLDLSDKINGFTGKVRRWIERVRNGVTAMFPCYTELNDGEKVDISDTICAHLIVLVDGFSKYFGDVENDLKTDKDWIRDPFTNVSANIPHSLTVTEEDKLIDLSNDSFLRQNFQNCGCDIT